MKSNFKRYKSTGSAREGDEFDVKSNPGGIRKNLDWVKEKYKVTKKSKSEGPITEDIIGGLYAKVSEIFPDISVATNSTFKGLVVKYAKALVDITIKGAINLYNNRKVKKTLMVFGGMAAGIAIGAIIGTLLFPVIGTAIGGAIGATITGVAAAVGAGVGLGVIGGYIGAKFGKKVDKITPIDRSYYNVAPKIRKRLNSIADLTNEESTQLNAYLTNRKNVSKEPLVKEALSTLRSKVFKEGDIAGLDLLSFYLTSEIQTLSELKTKSPEQEEDIQFLKKILNKLAVCKEIDKEVREHIQSALTPPELKNPEPSAVKPQTEKTKRPQAVIFSKPNLEQLPSNNENAIGYKIEQAPILREDAFNKLLKEHNKSIRKGNKLEYIQEHYYDTSNPGTREFQNYISRKNEDDFHLHYKESTQSEGHEVLITAELVGDNKDYTPLAQAATAFAKNYEDRLPSNDNLKLIVYANCDEDIAVQLLAEAQKHKLNAVLNPQEFPDKEQRDRIMKKAQDPVEKEIDAKSTIKQKKRAQQS